MRHVTCDPEKAARRAKQEMTERGLHLNALDHEHPSWSLTSEITKCLQRGEDGGQAGLEQDKRGTRNMGQYGVAQPGKNLCVFHMWLRRFMRKEYPLSMQGATAEPKPTQRWEIACVRGAPLANSQSPVNNSKTRTLSADQRRGAMEQSKMDKITQSVRRTRKKNEG